MPSKRKRQRMNAQQLPAPKPPEVTDKQVVEALNKYKELYLYSTDVLLREHERFTKADEKASRYSAVFVFLTGAAAFFGKWIFDKFPWSDFPVTIPAEWPLYITGVLALVLCVSGWMLTIHVIKLKPFVGRPLNSAMLDFFEEQSLLNIYYGLARENSKAWELNVKTTDEKVSRLLFAHMLVKLTLACLAELFVMYCIYSWC